MALRILILLFGVFACSTAAILIKSCDVPAILLSGSRLLVAALVLTPLFVRDLRRSAGAFTRRRLWAALLPGVMLGLHFITWNIGIRKATTVNGSLIVNLVPIVMPLFLLVFVRERLNLGEVIGTLVAMSGVGLLMKTDFDLSREYFQGDVICFGSMLLFAFYLVLGRRNRAVPTIWLYVTPMYYVGSLFCLAVAPLLENPIRAYSLKDVAIIVALGIVPTIFGHSILNYAMKHIRGQVVSVVNLGQFVFAGLMAYPVFGEAPGWALYVAAVCLVAGAVIVLKYQQKAAGQAPLSAVMPAETPAR